MKPYTGFVLCSDGEIRIQIAEADDAWALYSRDGEDSYPMANGLPNMTWKPIPARDPRLTKEDRQTLAWLRPAPPKRKHVGSPGPRSLKSLLRF